MEHYYLRRTIELLLLLLLLLWPTLLLWADRVIAAPTTLRSPHTHPPADKQWYQRGTKFVELAVVVDSTLYTQITAVTRLDLTTLTVSKYTHSVVNVVNGIFRKVGVITFTTQTHIFTPNNDTQHLLHPESNTPSLTRTLSFLRYLRSTYPNTPIDHLVILTTRNLLTDAGMMTGYFTMCGPESVSIVTAGMNYSTLEVAVRVSNAIAHTLGLSHDLTVPTNASHDLPDINQQTAHELKSLLLSLSLWCLVNQPPLDLMGGSCGNWIQEGGEQCDCGPLRYCLTECCNPETCMLRDGAECSTGPCCDLTSCRVQPPTVVCRGAGGECEGAVYCDGVTEYCEGASWHDDGTSCDSGQGFCYHGVCGSPRERCRKVWGGAATPCTPEEQRGSNMAGSSQGNCGYYFHQDRMELRPCVEEDALCGTLHCRNTSPQGLHLSPSIQVTPWGGGAGACRAVLPSQDYGQALWLAPHGTPCGEGKMCVGHQCVWVPSPVVPVVGIVAGVVVVVVFLALVAHYRLYHWLHRHCHTHHHATTTTTTGGGGD